MFFMTSKTWTEFLCSDKQTFYVSATVHVYKCFLFFLFEGIMLNSRKIQDIDFLTMVPRHSLGQMHSL